MRSALLVFAFLLLPPVPSLAETITVDIHGGGDYTEIQAAIDAATDTDTVIIKPGEYLIESPITFRGKAITVAGEKGPSETILRMSSTPTNPDRAGVVVFESQETAASILEGVTLRGGRGTTWGPRRWERGGGGVLVVMGSSPVLRNCTITGNSSEGLLCALSSSVSIVNSTVSGNSAIGVECRFGSAAALTNCIVWENGGGSMAADVDSVLTATHCAIQGADVWPGTGNINDDPLFCGWDMEEIHVDGSYPEPGDGSEENPYPDLLDALERYRLALSSGSPCLIAGEGGADMGADMGTCNTPGHSSALILLGPGTYNARGLNLLHRASLEGAGREETIIQGTVYGLRTGAVLSKVTVTGGTDGGIVVGPGEGPEIVNSAIAGNSTASRGGGLLCLEGSFPTFVDCTISGNSSGNEMNGGGVHCVSSSPTLVNCTISENRAGGNGGGVSCSDSFPTLIDCTITRNVADDEDGGGVSCSRSPATLIRCVISGNRADDDGGGIYCWEASPTMVNCAILGNVSSGLDCRWSSSPDIINCTIAENSESGILCLVSSAPSVTNCILWGNLDGAIASDEDSDPVVTYSCVEGGEVWPGDGNLNGDPLFVRPGHWDDQGTFGDLYDDLWVEGDYHLQPGSPALDAGTAEGAPETDLEGNARPCGDGIDMGAYEWSDCPGAGERFIRGDVDGNGTFGISDAILSLLYIFSTMPPDVDCLKAIDFDDNGKMGLADVIALLIRIFVPGSPGPPHPYPECGPDTTEDRLSCEATTAHCRAP